MYAKSASMNDVFMIISHKEITRISGGVKCLPIQGCVHNASTLEWTIIMTWTAARVLFQPCTISSWKRKEELHVLYMQLFVALLTVPVWHFNTHITFKHEIHLFFSKRIRLESNFSAVHSEIFRSFLAFWKKQNKNRQWLGTAVHIYFLC